MLSLEHVSDGCADSVSRERDLLTVIFVLNTDDISLTHRDVGFGIPVIFGVEGQVIQISFDVVSHNCNLRQSSVEGLGGWCIDNITQPKNISVFFVLKGLPINIKKSRFIGKSCIRKSSMGGGGHQGVKLTVRFFNKLP